MDSDHSFPPDITIRDLFDRTIPPLVDFAAAHLPPWWVWPALAVVTFLLAWLLRVRALRSLDVAAPTEAERIRARAAGQMIATRGTIGLVLGGGGAKGAYEVGCWKALRECGIARFGAIAGTSVGALNAILVAQDDYAKAEAIWYDMSFGRVLRLRWYALAAIAIRIVLLVPYLGKHLFPARAIPVPLWRAVRTYQEGMAKDGNPLHMVSAALDLYRSFVRSPTSTDMTTNLVLALIALLGLSAWWVLAAPLLTLVVMIVVAPFVALLVVSYASMFATLLDQMLTRLVLASNEPLHALLNGCVDVARLRERSAPLYATLGTLREVTRTITPVIPDRLISKVASRDVVPEPVTAPASDRDFSHSLGAPLPWSRSTIEYVPTYFDVRTQAPDRMRELILQSAGLPEIFPARRFDGVTYVDGGVADNEPLTALAGIADHALIIVISLNQRTDEAKVREQLAVNLERLGQPPPTALPELLVLGPSRSLSGMLIGTLDFTAPRARALLRLGYRDTINRLASSAGL